MSYASEVKKELTGIKVHADNAKAELMALIRMNGSLGIANQQMVLSVQTESPAIARRIYSLLKEFFAVESEIVVRRKMKLKKSVKKANMFLNHKLVGILHKQPW